MAKKQSKERREPVPAGNQPQTLSDEELKNQQPADLPDREAMSLANINLAAPINLAAALNVLSDGSIAAANAEQNTPIDQSTGIVPPTAP